MFELLTNGIVEMLCNKFRMKGIPYGFGGIAKLGDGLLPAEKIIMEHYRLGSTRAILSRTFCDNTLIDSIDEIERVFKINTKSLRDYEASLSLNTKSEFDSNRQDVIECLKSVVEKMKRTKNNEQ